MEKQGKLIISPIVAKKLLDMGNTIIDLKPNKRNPRETVFVFEVTNKLSSDLKSLSK